MTNTFSPPITTLVNTYYLLEHTHYSTPLCIFSYIKAVIYLITISVRMAKKNFSDAELVEHSLFNIYGGQPPSPRASLRSRLLMIIKMITTTRITILEQQIHQQYKISKLQIRRAKTLAPPSQLYFTSSRPGEKGEGGEGGDSLLHSKAIYRKIHSDVWWVRLKTGMKGGAISECALDRVVQTGTTQEGFLVRDVQAMRREMALDALGTENCTTHTRPERGAITKLRHGFSNLPCPRGKRRLWNFPWSLVYLDLSTARRS